jgi:hypothetical protein
VPLPLVCSRRQELSTATVDGGPLIVISRRRRRLLSCRISADRRRPPPAMPGLGATDPADLEAQARAELGFSRRLEQPRRVAPPPRFGGTGGYPVWYRELQLQRFNAGEAIDVSLASIYRWDDRLEPFRQTGNTERTTIVGADLLSLVTYITAWPDATLDKMAVFIYNEGGDLYSRQRISQRLAELDITKKRASTEGCWKNESARPSPLVQ